MYDDTYRFLDMLLSRCHASPDLCFTLTAIHPDGQHPTPSRHIPLTNRPVLQDALERLESANRCGWGAFFGVGLRKTGLSRYRRGGVADVVLLPALFVDIDDQTDRILQRLRQTQPRPSCIVSSGGGYHAYWWLDTPTTDLITAKQILRCLALSLDGDQLSPAQSLRLPGSLNTKPSRRNVLCKLVSLTDQAYALSDFAGWITHSHPASCVRQTSKSAYPASSAPLRLNPDVIGRAADIFKQSGYRLAGDWLKGPCLFPHRHHHADDHPSFGFNYRTGYGHCFRCGSILLKDICQCLQLDPHRYGGLCCHL